MLINFDLINFDLTPISPVLIDAPSTGAACAGVASAVTAALAVAEKVQPPALIMVGQVVQLHPLLARPGTVLQTAQAAQEAKELASA